MNHTFFNNKNSTVVFSASFPYDWYARGHSLEGIKKKPYYDIEWIVRNIMQVNYRNHATINMKFLYLTRDPYDTVLSHCEFEIHRAGYNNDTKCVMHTEVLERYTRHIANEYNIIDALQPGMWKLIRYEWFLKDHQCAKLVTSLVEFLDWGIDNCNIGHACAIINSKRRHPSSRPLDCKDYRHIISTNLTLDIADLSVPGTLEGVNETQQEVRRAQCLA